MNMRIIDENYYDLAVWTFKALDAYDYKDGSLSKNDIEEILDYINPMSEFELVKELIINIPQFLDGDHKLYEKEREIFDQIINVIIKTWKNGTFSELEKYDKLFSYIVESRN